VVVCNIVEEVAEIVLNVSANLLSPDCPLCVTLLSHCSSIRELTAGDD
jgi:hypothetical protein